MGEEKREERQSWGKVTSWRWGKDGRPCQFWFFYCG